MLENLSLVSWLVFIFFDGSNIVLKVIEVVESYKRLASHFFVKKFSIDVNSASCFKSLTNLFNLFNNTMPQGFLV